MDVVPDLRDSAGADLDEAAVLRPAPRGVIVVRVGGAEFGLPVGAVREVLRRPNLSRVPFPPPDVCGVLAHRGVLIPVVDLGLRLLGTPAERPGILVVVVDARTQEPLGLLADGVTGLVEAGDDATFDAPPEAEVTLPPGWVTGVIVPEPDRPVALLDLDLVVPIPALRDPLRAADAPQPTASQT